jgi:hypothetical protein
MEFQFCKVKVGETDGGGLHITRKIFNTTILYIAK